MAVFNFFYVIFCNSRQSTCQSIPLDTNSFAKCLKVIITYYSFLNIKTNRELIISRLTALKIVTQEQFQNHSLPGNFFKGGGGESKGLLFFVMPKIFHQILWRQGRQVVRTQDLQSGGPVNKSTTLPLTGLFLNGSLNSTPWLCFVCLLPARVFTACVYLQSLGLDCLYLSQEEVDFKSIQIHIRAHIPHIIKYNLLNQTDQI